MKPETRSTYEVAVTRVVRRIAGSLDEGLDLGVLAREAALSPFHFHRIFRGMLGETPLELQRRLRLERAAQRLLGTEEPVTRIALEAGYETHEAFTRAFRLAYGESPSGFREVWTKASCAAARTDLPARSGIHHPADGSDSADLIIHFHFEEGQAMLSVNIEDRPAMRIATMHHTGNYQRIGEAFARLGAVEGAGALFARPSAAMVALFYDDPETTPVERLQSDAGVSVPAGVALPAGVEEKQLPAGRYAHVTHVGPYERLPDVWSQLIGSWLPRSGNRLGDAPSHEIYRNTPEDTPPEQLRTDLYLHLA